MKIETPLEFKQAFREISSEISRVIVGHREAIEELLFCLFASGHALVEAVPGLGKTLLVRTLAECVGMSFSRIQCTPDLMPGDITGTDVLYEREGMKLLRFQPGPVFANVVLVDEVNRATPKTQSALLEAMQEGTVTVGEATHELEKPFIVIATQNPIELAGTYPLPEAQVDRFLFKILLRRPDGSELEDIVSRMTVAELPSSRRVLTREEVLSMQRLTREVVLSDYVRAYIVNLIQLTHPDTEDSPEEVKRYVRLGASPRAAIALTLAGKVCALSQGRASVSTEDIERVFYPSLRHRLILNFEAEADGVSAEEVLRSLLTGAHRLPLHLEKLCRDHSSAK